MRNLLGRWSYLDWCGPFRFLKTKNVKERDNCWVNTKLKKKEEKGGVGGKLVRGSTRAQNKGRIQGRPTIPSHRGGLGNANKSWRIIWRWAKQKKTKKKRYCGLLDRVSAWPKGETQPMVGLVQNVASRRSGFSAHCYSRSCADTQASQVPRWGVIAHLRLKWASWCHCVSSSTLWIGWRKEVQDNTKLALVKTQWARPDCRIDKASDWVFHST